jgi:signal transduction histidine kinase
VGIGTGIGLSVCQAVVQKLGGKISVRSAVGQGTTFEVRVPVESAALADAAPVQTQVSA